MSNKTVVCNNGALASKYGTAVSQIQAALQALVAADSARGIQTRFIALDDAATMQTFGAPPVTVQSDPQQNKTAVDAIFRALTPDYVLILGAPDLVPHQDLVNPLYQIDSDVDKIALSDLPYACDAPYSQSPQDFIGPTRVVGRLPDVTGGSDPQYLVNLLTSAANHRPAPASSYASYLGVTASVWTGSTALSLSVAFGNSTDMQVSPPTGPAWPHSIFSRKSHFFNCHGADTDPHFYGQQDDNYPTALDAAMVPGNLTQGTVMAAEACYGAQLYAPAAEPNRKMGMANAYLAAGCPAFFGSTTIAYGEFTTNANADLICQYFFESVLAGASAGRAALEARQRYAQANSSLSPTDLKTLAQYVLLGDPSLSPALAPDAAGHAIDEAQGRSDRRARLALTGREIVRTRAVSADRMVVPRSVTIDQRLADLARHFELDNHAVLSFSVQNAPEPSQYHVMLSRRRVYATPVALIRLVEVEARGEAIVRTRYLVSR
jgi:Peptidase family C25